MQIAVAAVTGLDPGAVSPPTELWAGLSSFVAGADGTGWTELTVDNYARQLVSADWLSTDLDGAVAVSDAEVLFADLGVGSYQSIGLFAAVTGGAPLFWADLDVEVDFEEGQDVPLAVGQIKVTLRPPA